VSRFRRGLELEEVRASPPAPERMFELDQAARLYQQLFGPIETDIKTSAS
jgi:hypothetical protein